MRYLLLTILLTTTLYSASKYELEIDSCLHNKAFEIAEGEIGVTEATGKNDGPRIAAYLKVTGLGEGYPYCAAGISWCYYQAAKHYDKPKSFIPFPMTAGSQVVYDHARKNGKKIKRHVRSQDFFIWRKKDSYQGHIGIIDKVKRKGWVETIEFNTSGSSRGSQRDGGGVWRKKRNLIHPLGRLRVRGFVCFKKMPSNLCKSKIIEIAESKIIESEAPNIREEKENLSFLERAYYELLKLRKIYV